MFLKFCISIILIIAFLDHCFINSQYLDMNAKIDPFPIVRNVNYGQPVRLDLTGIWPCNITQFAYNITEFVKYENGHPVLSVNDSSRLFQAGFYYCQNGRTLELNIIQVDVQFPPENRTVLRGTTYKFTCRFMGEVTSQLSMYVNDTKLSKGVNTFRVDYATKVTCVNRAEKRSKSYSAWISVRNANNYDFWKDLSKHRCGPITGFCADAVTNRHAVLHIPAVSGRNSSETLRSDAAAANVQRVIHGMFNVLFPGRAARAGSNTSEPHCLINLKRLICNSAFPACDASTSSASAPAPARTSHVSSNQHRHRALIICRDSCEMINRFLCPQIIQKHLPSMRAKLLKLFRRDQINALPFSLTYWFSLLTTSLSTKLHCDRLQFFSSNQRDQNPMPLESSPVSSFKTTSCKLVPIISVTSLKNNSENNTETAHNSTSTSGINRQCYQKSGIDYRGKQWNIELTKSTLKSQKKTLNCLPWNSLAFLGVLFPHSNLEQSYCRNPLGLFPSPVCLQNTAKLIGAGIPIDPGVGDYRLVECKMITCDKLNQQLREKIARERQKHYQNQLRRQLLWILLPIIGILTGGVVLLFALHRRSVLARKRKGKRSGTDDETLEMSAIKKKSKSLAAAAAEDSTGRGKRGGGGGRNVDGDGDDALLELVSNCLVQNEFFALQQLSGRLREKRWNAVHQLEQVEAIGKGQFGQIYLMSIASVTPARASQATIVEDEARGVTRHGAASAASALLLSRQRPGATTAYSRHTHVEPVNASRAGKLPQTLQASNAHDGRGDCGTTEEDGERAKLTVPNDSPKSHVSTTTTTAASPTHKTQQEQRRKRDLQSIKALPQLNFPIGHSGQPLLVAKILKQNASEELEKEFLRQADLLADFNHPNIVQLLGFCVSFGDFRSHVILLPYLPHGDLLNFLRRNSPHPHLLPTTVAAAAATIMATSISTANGGGGVAGAAGAAPSVHSMSNGHATTQGHSSEAVTANASKRNDQFRFKHKFLKSSGQQQQPQQPQQQQQNTKQTAGASSGATHNGQAIGSNNAYPSQHSTTASMQYALSGSGHVSLSANGWATAAANMSGSIVQRNKVKLMPIGPPTLIRMAFHVADAMLYLSDRGFVHRDLSARCCLVGGDLCAKLADFSLCRPVDNTPEKCYYGNENECVSVRWLPLESLLLFRYSLHTDVWSFGVLLWELFSFGLLPYEHFRIPEIIQKLSTTEERLPRPNLAPEDVYQIMLACWNSNPLQRPNFLQLQTLLREAYFELTGDNLIV